MSRRCRRRATSATFTPSCANRSAKSAPHPSDAPTISAHGPYFWAMSPMGGHHSGEPHRGVGTTVDPPTICGAHGVVVVVADGIRTRAVLHQDESVDVGADRCGIAVD